MSRNSACPGKADSDFPKKNVRQPKEVERNSIHSIEMRAAGYTLLEMMAVMLIIALVASLVITMTPGTGRPGLKAVTLATAALLRRERTAAILGGRERHVALDGSRRILVGEGGDTVTIPRDVAVDLLGADAVWAGRQAVVRFDPDGASTGAVLRLSHEKAEYEIRVNWFTGGVDVVAISPPQ
jgi:general secretion pathway protein H